MIPLRLLLSLLLAGLLSCGRAADGRCMEDSVLSEAVEESESNDLTVKARYMADSVLSELTLRERVGQCFMPTVFARSDEESMVRMSYYIDSLKVGGIVFLKGNLQGAATLASAGMKARVPLFTAIDAEWGLGMRLEDAPYFPRNGHLPADADERLLFDYGSEVARECRRVGINMVLGPVMDVAGGKNSFIGSRSFGDNRNRVADLGVAYARGVEAGGVISVAKHFPGHGSPAGDSHHTLPVIERSLHQLDSVDLYPFRRYIEEGLSGIMVGHLAVPAIDPRSLPAAVSEVVINKLLRGDLGFEGLVITDAFNMGGAAGYGAVDALKAGADIVIGTADTRGEIAAVMQALESGYVSQESIEDRCRRILMYKVLSGMWEVDIPMESGLQDDVSRYVEDIKKKLYGHPISN